MKHDFVEITLESIHRLLIIMLEMRTGRFHYSHTGMFKVFPFVNVSILHLALIIIQAYTMVLIKECLFSGVATLVLFLTVRWSSFSMWFKREMLVSSKQD